MSITLTEIIKAGGVIFILLFALSIYSIAVIIERYKFFRKNMNSDINSIRKFRHNIKIKKTFDLKEIVNQKNIVSEIIIQILNHKGTGEEKRKHMENFVEYKTLPFSKNLNFLATIGSTAPYIGLLGTVIGVIRAFKDMAFSQSAGPSVIAHGISEALVNTAMGLFVAIPAVIAYNLFINKINKYTIELDWLITEIFASVNKNENS